MHDIEPYYSWRHLYTAEEDERSPFFGREYSEFAFSLTVYNYYIHPQWDEFGSRTLYLKLLFVDYDQGFAIIELIGEWNDAIENDVMTLKREIVDRLLGEGIYKYILIAENVLNFHSSDADYYEEWIDDIRDEGGWVVRIGFPEAARHDFLRTHIDRYIELMDFDTWRTVQPGHLFAAIDHKLLRRLNNR
jgi:hypothetical protein